MLYKQLSRVIVEKWDDTMEMGLFTFAFMVKPVIESQEFFSHKHLRQI